MKKSARKVSVPQNVERTAKVLLNQLGKEKAVKHLDNVISAKMFSSSAQHWKDVKEALLSLGCN